MSPTAGFEALGAVERSLFDRLIVTGGVLFGGITLYIIGLSIYRLYFHPLSKFPGPWTNAISDLPGVIWTLQGRLPMQTKLLHDRYGPVVRLSPNELAFNSVRSWTDIYGHKPGRPDLAKDPIHVGAVDPMPGVSTISMADRETHARQRKALSHGFSKKALWEQESIVAGFVDKMIGHFGRFADTGEVFDCVKWYNFVTFDVIGDLAFGEHFGCLEVGENHWWIELIFNAVKAGAIEQASRRFATAGSTTQQWLMKRFISPKLRQQRAEHLAYSREKVMRRINTKTDRKDFTHYILKQSEHYDLSQDEVIVNAALFIVAGSETTASSLASLTNFLLRYPKVYLKLKDEIRGAFEAENEICLATVSELPYLSACLEENLRMFPPAPIGFLRSIQSEGDVVDGHHIPGGTAVSTSSWCAAHSPDNFLQPDVFIPERWLPDDKRFANDQKLASRPFSLGPRGCIGKDLAYLEMRLVVARVVWNFDLENADEAKEWEPEGNMRNMRAYSTWQKPPLLVKAKRVVR